MELTPQQYECIANLLPLPRGGAKLANRQVLNAILYVAEHGCKWRGLPRRFGPWHTVYTRMSCWSKSGVLQQVFKHLQQAQVIRIRIQAVSLDSTIARVHPDGTGALKKNGAQSIGKSRGGWTTKIHLVAADARCAITFALSPGQAHDAPEGRKLIQALGRPNWPVHLILDRAYEGEQTRQLALALGFEPVVPPKSNRLEPWQYDAQMYRRRNEVERLFRRLKGFRRVFSRFDKLDVMFLGFITFAFIVEALRDLC